MHAFYSTDAARNLKLLPRCAAVYVSDLEAHIFPSLSKAMPGQVTQDSPCGWMDESLLSPLPGAENSDVVGCSAVHVV